MREIRQSGSEGGVAQANALLLPLSQGIGALNPRDAVGRFILRPFGIAALGLVKKIWLCAASRCRDINSPARPLAHRYERKGRLDFRV